MGKLKKGIIILCLAGCIACAPGMTVRVQAAQTSTAQAATASGTMTAAQVDKLIDAISDTRPTAASVSAARQAYDALPMADQVNVTKYDKLAEAEKKIADQQPANFETQGAGSSTWQAVSGQPGHSGTSPAMLLVFAAACVAVILVIKKYPAIKTKSAGNSGKKPAAVSRTDTEQKKTMTDEEEIEQIREEFRREKASGMYDDPEPKGKEKEKSGSEKPSEDDRLTQTVEDEGDESDIQDLDDGFFTQSRFSK